MEKNSFFFPFPTEKCTKKSQASLFFLHLKALEMQSLNLLNAYTNNSEGCVKQILCTYLLLFVFLGVGWLVGFLYFFLNKVEQHL